MNSNREALILYKTLHRTVQRVFKGDFKAMFAARDKVCDEFNKYKNVTNKNAIEGLIKQGWEAQTILAQTVVQIDQVNEDKYQMNIRDETFKFENNPFRDDITDEQYRGANRKSRKMKTCDEKSSP